MRKYTPLVGCLKHNPRHSRFPIPNAVWKYKLKPIEFVLLSYFCCQHSHDSTNVSPEMAAKGTHMTVVTVKKYLDSLGIRCTHATQNKHSQSQMGGAPHLRSAAQVFSPVLAPVRRFVPLS